MLRQLLDKWKKEQTPKQASAILQIVQDIFIEYEQHNFEREDWKHFLDITGSGAFLKCLPTQEERNNWAEQCFRIIRFINYNLLDLFSSRVEENPHRIFLQDMTRSVPIRWTYRQTEIYLYELGAVFHKLGGDDPRVAILSENSLDSACCDIACLCFDIYDTPLNIHFNIDILTDIFDRTGINIAVADNQDRLETLLQVKNKVKKDFKIFVIDENIDFTAKDIYYLREECRKLRFSEAVEIVRKRSIKPANEVCTTMFTSGSSGLPKGVSFSSYNLITKRFARAAALPDVEDGQAFVCYLPLFHTFGRFLDLMGSIYWRGTYILAGNASSETILSLFPLTNPTGFISVPIRWGQLYEKCLQKLEEKGADSKEDPVKEAIGTRLSWGLSAAGYLDPKIFRFFRRHGVILNSGFGMTEATGGILMTPPDDYKDNSVGVPLPGIYARLTDEGELQLRGHYVARYLDDKGPGDLIEYPVSAEQDWYLSTGDVFRKDDDGHYEIIDRLKDIYKNNKGQTIAPKIVEDKFTGVPGIKRTFLVGDGMPYNVLLIVPDETDDSLLNSVEEIRNEYFRRIIAAANQTLAPYERVINFALLDRDFELDKGELTPKGSVNRKKVLENFAKMIKQLYKSNYLELNLGFIKVNIPRWFYRDLSILEHDIVADEWGLYDKRNNRRLLIKQNAKRGTYQIGDLEYKLDKKLIDLGIFCRQPLLWVGNPSLTVFSPCKEGWDTMSEGISKNAILPEDTSSTPDEAYFNKFTRIRDSRINAAHQLICASFFGTGSEAEDAINQMSVLLNDTDDRVRNLIRRRLEALSRHRSEEIRALAYRILLIDEPDPEYAEVFPSFLESGLSFLNEKSIEIIASGGRLEKRRLEAFRQRLHNYRHKLSWPISDTQREQFKQIFRLLVNFVKKKPEYYASVRGELSNWILHTEDIKLSKIAKKLFYQMADHYESELAKSSPTLKKSEWDKKIIYDQNIAEHEIPRLRQVLTERTFLRESIILAFDEPDFNLKDIPDYGVWASKLLYVFANQIYRVSINTKSGKHYDLQVAVNEDLKDPAALENVFWLIKIEGYPFGPAALPRLGCARPELGARSMHYHGDLTLWEKLREISSMKAAHITHTAPTNLRKLYIIAITAFFRAWKNSDKKILPGIISPTNVITPELDFREGSIILSISGWKRYDNTLSMLKPILYFFYFRVQSHYPWMKEQLDLRWIFDAAIEGLGENEGIDFLNKMRKDLEKEPKIEHFGTEALDNLTEYLNDVENLYQPVAVLNAIDRYYDWLNHNPLASKAAKLQTVEELYRLYQLQRYNEINRFILFRNTYFGGSDETTLNLFDDLVTAIKGNKNAKPAQLTELSELFSAMNDQEDIQAFNLMVFPKQPSRQRISFKEVTAPGKRYVIVESTITDKKGANFIFREPVTPAEIGQLYRLFFQENYPKTISAQDNYFVVVDENEKVIGGVCYKFSSSEVAQLDGSVIASHYSGRGIGSQMIELFVQRMDSISIKVIKTHFFLRSFYQKKGFNVDTKWGALVKFLEKEEANV